jgi:molybdate transport system substrate-binding protein
VLGRSLGLALSLALSTSPAATAETTVAVAANFIGPAEEIGAAFRARTGDAVRLSSAATGSLYTQITQAAPFTVFLAADSRRPANAVTAGYGVEGTVFTYAVGKLALYSPTLDLTDGLAALNDNAFEHLAIADPNTTPYGAAAMQTIEALGLADTVAAKTVTGESVAQTMQFVESGNAEIGFVALSQVADKPATQIWLVPDHLYSPILQDAVLLTTGQHDPVAVAFLEFLRCDEARAIIEAYGYEVPAP